MRHLLTLLVLPLQGYHMVPVLNALGVHCAAVGNHDVDWGIPKLEELIGDCHFPWLLANVLDRSAKGGVLTAEGGAGCGERAEHAAYMPGWQSAGTAPFTAEGGAACGECAEHAAYIPRWHSADTGSAVLRPITDCSPLAGSSRLWRGGKGGLHARNTLLAA